MNDFKVLPNLELNYKKMRFFTLLFIVFCLVVTTSALFYSYLQVEESKRNIYVLDNLGSMMIGTKQDVKMTRPIEARAHVRRFHDLLLTLTPDDKAINDNLNSAVAMADNSAYVYYSDLAEKGYYQRIISGDVIQTILCDSVTVNVDSYPYSWRYYGKQRITRASKLVVRKFISEGQLVDVVRSDNNPSGFLLTQFHVIDNSEIKSETRNTFIQ